MQDHKLGKRCQVPECRQIDWMPMGCKYCSRTFCCEHYSIESHSCQQIDKNFKKVMQCPFCMTMITVNHNISHEENLSIHQAMDCKGKPETTKVATCANQKCKAKITEINKFECGKCGQTVCLKHRLQAEHTCENPAKRRWLGFISCN